MAITTFFISGVFGQEQPPLPWWYDPLIRVATVLIIIFGAYISVRVYRLVVDRALHPSLPSIAPRIKILGSWFIWVVAILIALPSIGLETTILTYTFLLVGLAVVLASKDMLANLITEQVLATQPQFKIGNWIRVEGYYGRVVEMSSIHTIIMTAANERVVVPNSFFSNHIIVNQTAYGGVCVDIPIIVDRKYDVTDIEKELLRIGEEVSGKELEDHSPRVVVQEVGGETAKLILRLWTLNPARIESIRSEANKRIGKLLERLEEGRTK